MKTERELWDALQIKKRIGIEWLEISEDTGFLQEDRVLIFSPCYSKQSEMRYRTISGNFVSICKEATHWARLVDPEIKNVNSKF